MTQAVDREDPNLGAFWYWFDALGRRADSLVLLAKRVGAGNLPSGTEVYSLDASGRGGRMRRLYKFWELFSRHFARSDAVLFHQIPEFVIAASPFLIGRRKIAALWYAHGAVTRRLRFAERRVDYVFTSSLDGFRIPSKKAIVLGQAINTDFFQPVTGNQSPVTSHELRLLTVGRISPVKDCEIIIGACSLLKQTWSRPWSLSIVGGQLHAGDRTYIERLKTLVLEKGLSAYVRFHGERPYSEMAQTMRDHDLFLNTSRTGSLDKAVLEAMACGLTVVTSNEAYRTVLPAAYFLERSSPESLAERIKALADEPRPNTSLREIVVRDHALSHTIEKLFAHLSVPV